MKKEENIPASRQHRQRRRRREESEGAQDLSGTKNRRQRNSGFRRFRHLMKRPGFSRNFWIVVLSVCGVGLIALVVWDRFYR